MCKKLRKQETEIKCIVSTVIHFPVYKINFCVSESTMGCDTDAYDKLYKENLPMMTP